MAHAFIAVRPALLFAALPQVCYSCSAVCCKAPYFYIDPVIEYDSSCFCLGFFEDHPPRYNVSDTALPQVKSTPHHTAVCFQFLVSSLVFECDTSCLGLGFFDGFPCWYIVSAATLMHASSCRTSTGTAFEFVLPWWVLVSAKFHVRQLLPRPQPLRGELCRLGSKLTLFFLPV